MAEREALERLRRENKRLRLERLDPLCGSSIPGAAAGSVWGLAIEPLDEPGGVVDGAEHEQCEPELFEGVEGLDPEQVLLERSDEALRAAIVLGRWDERWRAPDAEEAHLRLEGVGHVLRAVIATNGKAAGDVLADGAEVPSHAQVRGSRALKRLPRLVSVNADLLGVVNAD